MRNLRTFVWGAFAMLLMLGACKHNTPAIDETQIQTGDLLFVALPLDYSLDEADSMDAAIAASTGDSGEVNFIHVAILEVEGDSTWVIDATIKHGVDRYPLDTFLCDFTLLDGSKPRIDIMRLKDNSEAARFVEQAKRFCGRKYDFVFDTTETDLYCSELVRDSYVTAAGDTLFAQYPMNWKSADGTYPEYWVQIFDFLGCPIPQGLPGTNPNAMIKDPKLTFIHNL